MYSIRNAVSNIIITLVTDGNKTYHWYFAMNKYIQSV